MKSPDALALFWDLAHLDAPVITCTGKDVPMPYAANLEKHALITTDEVVNRMLAAVPAHWVSPKPNDAFSRS